MTTPTLRAGAPAARPAQAAVRGRGARAGGVRARRTAWPRARRCRAAASGCPTGSRRPGSRRHRRRRTRGRSPPRPPPSPGQPRARVSGAPYVRGGAHGAAGGMRGPARRRAWRKPPKPPKPPAPASPPPMEAACSNAAAPIWSYCCRFCGSRSTSYALFTSWNFDAASGLSCAHAPVRAEPVSSRDRRGQPAGRGGGAARGAAHLVRVGVELLCELVVRLFNLRVAGALGHAQDVVVVPGEAGCAAGAC